MPRNREKLIEEDYQKQANKFDPDDDIGVVFGEPTRKNPDPVPDLTYENRREQLSKADHVMLTFKAPSPGDPTDDLSEDLDTLSDAIIESFGDWFTHENAFYRWEQYLYLEVKIEDENTGEKFPDFEAFLEQHIAYWEKAAITYSYERTLIGRSNAIIYDRVDNKPVYPGSIRAPEFESDEERGEQLAKWENYIEENGYDNPDRYEYKPEYVVNGDHMRDGFDVMTWSYRELNFDIRFEAHESCVGNERKMDDGSVMKMTQFVDARSFPESPDRLPDGFEENMSFETDIGDYRLPSNE